MKDWIQDKYSKVGFTRYKRIRNYVELLEEKIVITKEEDKMIVRDIKVLIAERIKAVKTLYVLNTLAYFGIYFSFISYYMSDVFLLPEFTEFLGRVIGFFGTTLFVIMLFFATRLSDLYYEDLSLLSAHLIAIHNKYRPKEDHLFGAMNEYISFINFFKNR